jgi:hypothetical protein
VYGAHFVVVADWQLPFAQLAALVSTPAAQLALLHGPVG